MSPASLPPIKVKVLSEHPVVRVGVAGLLGHHSDRVRIVPEHEVGDDVVALYDVFGLHETGERELELLVKGHPGRVLALARELQPGLTARALSLGAVASVSIGADAEQLLDAIERLAAGELQDGSQADMDNQADRRRQLGRDVDLTPREQDVLALIVAGRSNDDLAAELYLSINTVKTLIRSVYRKIGVASRSQAVAWGVEHGFPSEAQRRS